MHAMEEEGLKLDFCDALYATAYPALQQLVRALRTIHGQGIVMNKLTPHSLAIQMLPEGQPRMMVRRPPFASESQERPRGAVLLAACDLCANAAMPTRTADGGALILIVPDVTILFVTR
jgi:hypothetical protein